MADKNEISDLKKTVKVLEDEYKILQDHLAEIELKYQAALSNQKNERRQDEEENKEKLATCLLETVSELFNNKLYSDMKILLEDGRIIHAHRLILSARTKYWGDYDLNKLDLLDLSYLRTDVGYHVIKWVYTDEIDLLIHKDDFLIELLEASIKFRLNSLYKRCEKALISFIDHKNCKKLYLLATELCCDLLKKYCREFLDQSQSDNTEIEEIIESLNFPPEEKPELDDEDEDVEHIEEVVEIDGEVIEQVVNATEQVPLPQVYIDTCSSITEDLPVTEHQYLPTIDCGQTTSNNSALVTDEPDIKSETGYYTGLKNENPANENQEIQSKDLFMTPSKLSGSEHTCSSEKVKKSSITLHSKLSSQIGVEDEIKLEECDDPDNTADDIIDTSVTKENNVRKPTSNDTPLRSSKRLATAKVHNSHKCRICGKEFSYGAFRRHMKMHKGEKVKTQYKRSVSNLEVPKKTEVKEKSISCDLCEKTFSARKYLSDHIKTHNRTQKYSCNLCEKSYFDPRSLRRHERTHSIDNPYICDFCGKSLRDGCSLKEHRRLHTGERPFECSICSKTFPNNSGFKSHMIKHSGVKPFACETCGKTFYFNSQLRIHMRTHTGEKPFKCPHCDKTFADKRHFPRHLRMHSGERPYQCEVCGKSFIEGFALSNHVKIHSGIKPHKCEYCSKTFTQRAHLSKHIKSHLGAKDFICDICGSKFYHKAHLIRHCRIHSGEKPYTCTVCDRSFTRDDYLSKHMATHYKRAATAAHIPSD